jgi:hypothetical protein
MNYIEHLPLSPTFNPYPNTIPWMKTNYLIIDAKVKSLFLVSCSFFSFSLSVLMQLS